MVDMIVLLLLFVMLMTGFGRGAVPQLWSLGAFAASTYVAGNVYPFFVGWADRVVRSPNGGEVLSFILVFALCSLVVNGLIVGLVRPGHRPEEDTPMSERAAGAVLGLIEGLGLAQVGAALFVAHPVLGWDRWIASSRVLATIFSQLPIMIPLLPSDWHIILEVFR